MPMLRAETHQGALRVPVCLGLRAMVLGNAMTLMSVSPDTNVYNTRHVGIRSDLTNVIVIWASQEMVSSSVRVSTLVILPWPKKTAT